MAAGYYATAADQVERYRRAVDDEVQGADLERGVADLRAGGHRIEGYRLKSAPRGYPRDTPGSSCCGTAPCTRPGPGRPSRGCTPLPAQRVRQAWRDYAPLMSWLDRNVGPSTHNH